MKIGGMCVNWKVVAGLVVAGAGIWIAKPGLIGAALPLLLLAACPLSMLLMMRGMGHQRVGQPYAASRPVSAGQSPPTGLARDKELAELRAWALTLQSRHEAIVRELARLEGEPPPAVREAEAVALAADQRARG